MTYKNDLEEHLLVHLHELLVPLLDVCSFLAAVGVVIVLLHRVLAVVLAPLNDLPEHGLVHLRTPGQHMVLRTGGSPNTYIGNRNGLSTDSLITKILHHVLDQDGALCDLAIWPNVSDAMPD
jgi:hypothetical protein